MCILKNIWLGAVLVVLAQYAYGQSTAFTSQPTRGQYSLVAYISGGAGYFLSGEGTPRYLNPRLSKVAPVGTVRILWHPDHLLKAGLETGHITFYSYRFTDSSNTEGRLGFHAVPILLEWSMSVTKHFNIFAGPGLYFLNTRLNYAGKTSSYKVSAGWMAAASYIFSLSPNAGLGTEAKWLYASETAKGSLCLQLQFVWKFLKW